MKAFLTASLLGTLAALCLAQDSAVRRIRVGGQVQAALAVSKIQAVYPPLAKQARIQGIVRLEALIGRQGKVENLKVISGHPLLVQAALDAVRQWQYKPTFLDGEAVEVITTIDVNFSLAEPMSAEAVEQAEQALRSNPEDLATRFNLIQHYATANSPARRAHVLWLIEHHPEAGLHSAPEAMLFPAGFKLADPEGYEQAKRLWLNQTARTSDPLVIRHAALFLMIRDREFAETVLLNARAMQPDQREWPSLLGRLYGEGVLGLVSDPRGTTTSDPQERRSVFAQRALTALDSSTDVNLLRSADMALSRYRVEAGDPQLDALAARIKQRLPPMPPPAYRINR
jgi:TonB family protein